MRILIATGIFEPEAGGPATFAPKLARLLAEKGWDVTVLTYSARAAYEFDHSYPFKVVRISRGGKIFNRIRFFLAMLRHAGDRDLIYTLDWFAVGLPVALAAAFLKKPYIVRVGGDYLWEQRYLESGARPITLFEFYARRMYTHGTYYLLYLVIRRILSRARHVIFNSDVQKDLYVQHYHLPAHAVSVCYNAVPRTELAVIRRGRPNHEFVYWGRFNVMKNVTTLVRAFARATLPDPFTLVLIGSGPQAAKILDTIREFRLEKRVRMEPVMRPREVIERIKNARAFVLPSWTDISPNQVHEALAIGLPGLVTKENYLHIRERLPITIDPSSIDDIASKLQMLANERTYADFAARFKTISFTHDWNEVVDEHCAVFASVMGRTGHEVRVLQIGADRSRRGILYPDSAAIMRQKAYGEKFGHLDIVGFSRVSDGRVPFGASPHVHVYPTNSVSPFLYWFDALKIARALPRPDVVSAQDPFETGFVGWLIARMRGVPLHAQVHTDFLSLEYARLSFLNRIRVAMAGFVLRRASRIRVVSDRIKSSIERKYHLHIAITILPMYVDIEKFKNAQPLHEWPEDIQKYEYKLLIVSRAGAEKNVQLAVDAFRKVAPQNACLIIIGDTEPSVVPQDSRVYTIGNVNPERYFKSADLVLVPSKYEGYGLVIIEALAAGTPVLSTDVGIAREAGAIIASPEKFANALAEWFDHGPREGHLKEYPYKNFDAYVEAYCDDVKTSLRFIIE